MSSFQQFLTTITRPARLAGTQEERIAGANALVDLDDPDLLCILASRVSGDHEAAAIVAILRERARAKRLLPIAAQ